MKDALHLIHRGDRWTVKRAGAVDDLMVTATHSAAIYAAHAIAMREGRELVVFPANGCTHDECRNAS